MRFTPYVALLAEGVDRNIIIRMAPPVGVKVALLAEGVDRNHQPGVDLRPEQESPSSRRAWIEITFTR